MKCCFKSHHVILTIVALCNFNFTSYAATYYVSTNGNDSNLGTTEDKPFRTVQKAADIANAGDIVLVKQGTYPGFHIRNKHGRADAWIVFKPYPGDEKRVILDPYTINSANRIVIEFSGCSYIEINGFEITDSNPLYDSEKFDDYIQGENSYGIRLNSAYGSYSHSSYIRIIKNHIYHIGRHGIYSGYYTHHNEFINNHLEDIGKSMKGYGMYIGGDDHIIRGNFVHKSCGFGICVYSTIGPKRILVENNILFNNGRDDFAKGWDWRDCKATGCPYGSGLTVGGSDHIVRNNICYVNRMAGMSVSSANSVVVNNTCYKNHGPTYEHPGIWVDGQNAIVRNNISYQNTGGDYYSGNSNTQDHNLFGVDPLFVDPDRGDFHLQAGSPSIDAGVPIPGFDTDIDSTTRPQGGGWDIGAYEFGGTPFLKAYLNANPTSGLVPLTVNFSGNAANGKTPYSYSWDFGDGNSSIEQNPTHIYAQINSYAVKLTVTDSGNKQATASRLIVVEANSGNEPSVVNLRLAAVDQTGEFSSITPDEWYDLYVHVDDPQGWNDISYADVWLSDESNNEGTIANRGGRYFASTNYVISYSIADGGIWARETEGTTTWTNLTGKLGLYVDDDNNEYEQNSSQKWAKARIKLLPSAILGNWSVKAYVIDKEKHISNLFDKKFSVAAAGAPTASITLSDPSPTRAGEIQVILMTSNVVTKLPTPLIFTESDNSTTQIDLSGSVPGDTFTGIFVVDEAVADGIGYFALPADALIDVNGIKGNEIKSGAFVRIDKTPPANPQNVKVDYSPP